MDAGDLNADQQRRDGAHPDFSHDRRQVGGGSVKGHAAEGIVAAEAHDHRIRFRAEHPVEPRPPAARGVARDTGVLHPHVPAARAEPRLKLHRQALPRGEAEALHQAVAKGHDAQGAGLCRRSREGAEA
ncbi:hypothetical protein CG51_13810 [Haematobacter missouriensis]|nr:hypothetical protein CG51_13810 [Haematobacter missouriensis]